MILLDTHIWLWWVSESDQLPGDLLEIIHSHADDAIGVSIISCWEVAKLVEYDRLKLTDPVEQWIDQALAYPGVQLLDLTPKIVVDSTQLPGEFFTTVHFLRQQYENWFGGYHMRYILQSITPGG